MNLEVADSPAKFSKTAFQPSSKEHLKKYISHKQRVIAIGDSAHSVCVLVTLLMQELGIAVDYLLSKESRLLNATTQLNDDANVVLIEGSLSHDGSRVDIGGLDCLSYAYHIGLVCDINCRVEEKGLENFIQSLPKGGALFFPSGFALEKFLGKRNADVKYTEVCEIKGGAIPVELQYLLFDGDQKFLCNEYFTPQTVRLGSALLKYFGVSLKNCLEALEKVGQKFFRDKF